MTIRVGAYVDGFNLYHGLHEATGRRDLWLDLESLLTSMLRPGQQLAAVHYFTALVQGGPGPQRRQQRYMQALEAHGSVTTCHEGRFQHKTPECKACGHTWSTYEEKESDVALAVQAVADVAQGLVEQAWFVSGDSDMVPAVKTIRRIAPSVRTVAIAPPRRSSVVLNQQVHGTLRIFDKTPRRHQLPHSVWHAETQQNLTRPTRWSAPQ